MKDLELFDEEMIKIVTAYLNSPKNTDGKIDLHYLDELRFRTANKRSI